jgi:hypothetical protein
MKVSITDKSNNFKKITHKFTESFLVTDDKPFFDRNPDEIKACYKKVLESYDSKCWGSQILDPSAPKGKRLNIKPPSTTRLKLGKCRSLNANDLAKYKGRWDLRLILCPDGSPYRRVKDKDTGTESIRYNTMPRSNVDIDCDSRHTDGWKVLEYVESLLGGKTFSSTSIRGFGINAEFRINRIDENGNIVSAYVFKSWLVKLDKFLKQEIKKQNFNIGAIEVKGMPIVNDYGNDETGKPIPYTGAGLVSIAPDLLDRYYEWERCVILDKAFFDSLIIDEVPNKSKAKKKLREGERTTLDEYFKRKPHLKPKDPKPAPKFPTAKKSEGGSLAFDSKTFIDFFSKSCKSKQVKKLVNAAYNSDVKTFAQNNLKYRTISKDHIRDHLIIHLFLEKYPLDIDCKPTEAIRFLWKIAKENDLTERGFDGSLNKWVRTILISINAYQWIDRTYQRPYYTTKNGTIHKQNGLACKYNVNKELVEFVKSSKSIKSLLTLRVRRVEIKLPVLVDPYGRIEKYGEQVDKFLREIENIELQISKSA